MVLQPLIYGCGLVGVSDPYRVDTYLREQVGRAATGLSTSDPDFAILPPHFNTTKGPVISVQEWEDILPGY